MGGGDDSMMRKQIDLSVLNDVQTILAFLSGYNRVNSGEITQAQSDEAVRCFAKLHILKMDIHQLQESMDNMLKAYDDLVETLRR